MGALTEADEFELTRQVGLATGPGKEWTGDPGQFEAHYWCIQYQVQYAIQQQQQQLGKQRSLYEVLFITCDKRSYIRTSVVQQLDFFRAVI